MTAQEHRPELEQFYRQFLHVEIAIGLTYARLARMAYAEGHVSQGNQIAGMAAHAKAEVARWLEDAETSGFDVADLTEEYQALRAALMKLPPPAQMAA